MIQKYEKSHTTEEAEQETTDIGTTSGNKAVDAQETTTVAPIVPDSSAVASTAHDDSDNGAEYFKDVGSIPLVAKKSHTVFCIRTAQAVFFSSLLIIYILSLLLKDPHLTIAIKM